MINGVRNIPNYKPNYKNLNIWKKKLNTLSDMVRHKRKSPPNGNNSS